MTGLLDADGNTLDDANDWDWIVVALFEWLEDLRTREIIIARGLLSRNEMTALRRIIEAAFRKNVPMRHKDLREHLLRFLRDRVVRMSLVRVVLKSEAESRRIYDEICERFPARMSHWEASPEDTRGPQPELPDAPIDPRPRSEVMAELQRMRLELEDLEVRDRLTVDTPTLLDAMDAQRGKGRIIR